MRIIELFEARSHPQQNTKLSTDNELKQIAKKYGTDNIFVTFTRIDKFGINPSSQYRPIGLYCYPLGYVLNRGIMKVPFAASMPYIWIFRNEFPKENIWDLSKPLTPEFIDRLVKGEKSPSTVKVNNQRNFITNSIRDAGKLKNIGIYGLLDLNQNIIHPALKTQAVFFSISKLVILDKIRNRHQYHNGRDPENPPHQPGKPEDMADPGTIYHTAVRKGRRYRKLEHFVTASPYHAYFYAKDVIEDRWPEAEPIIMKDPGAAYGYAKDVIQDRWPEAEPYIMKNPYYAYLYAKDIIEDRWSEAEPYIKTTERYWQFYQEFLRSLNKF